MAFYGCFVFPPPPPAGQIHREQPLTGTDMTSRRSPMCPSNSTMLQTDSITNNNNSSSSSSSSNDKHKTSER
ncbi:unnamed protein product [Ceratitis capitata]|uniref:(Mediterranean fruit fly) hypothetical protein n=1 Tax=Ceratitis capitata TaxID=7213 RepID=A0A811UUZ6_CERCA|nr:unnamed protein product [Ceratitis capitata]